MANTVAAAELLEWRRTQLQAGGQAMGAIYVKGRVAKVTEQPDGNLVLHYEDIVGE